MQYRQSILPLTSNTYAFLLTQGLTSTVPQGYWVIWGGKYPRELPRDRGELALTQEVEAGRSQGWGASGPWPLCCDA